MSAEAHQMTTPSVDGFKPGPFKTRYGPQNVFMDRFTSEPKTQRAWKRRHATWFTLMAIGGAVYVLARALGAFEEFGAWLGIPVVEWVSFGTIAVGGAILINYLSKPWRLWRTFSNPRYSWITWGAISDFTFLIAAGLLVAPDLRVGDAQPFAAWPWDAAGDSGFGIVLLVLAMVAAVAITVYAGAVLAAPRAIPYWHSLAVPLQFVASGGAMAMAVLLSLGVWRGHELEGGRFAVMAGFIAALLALIGWHLSTRREAPGKKHSLDLLLRGTYRVAFLGGVVLVGTVVPLVLAVIAIGAPGIRDVAAVVDLVLLVASGWALRLLTLRVGIFPPLTLGFPERQPVPVRPREEATA